MIRKKGWINVMALGAICAALSRLIAANDAHAQTWPNEPDGFQQLTSHPFNAPTGNGWTTPFMPYKGSMTSDPTAPVSGPSAIHSYRNSSSNNGGDFQYMLPSGTREFFFSYAVKLSLPHYGWFNGQYQKLHLLGVGPPHMYLYVYNLDNSKRTGSFQQADAQNSTPNGHVTGCSGGDCPFPCNISSCIRSLGQWHKVEIYYKAGNGNGILRQYLDGVLTTSYSNLYLPAISDAIWLCNIWDSINTQLPQTEWVEYDHAYISVPGGSGSTTTPPASPTNLRVN